MVAIPKPPFPNVPKLPGVPQILRSPIFPAAPPRILGLAVAGARLWRALFTQSGWGIYKRREPTAKDENGVETVTTTAKRVPVVEPDSFIDFGFRDESTVSDYPVQQGGFASYNKVANPSETFVRMSKGGTLRSRKAFLQSLQDISGTLEFYDVVTPEKTYLNVNVLRYEVARRGAEGAYFLAEVDLYFREIREVAATYSTTGAQTQNAVQPDARGVANNGTVAGQSTAATPLSLGIEGRGP